MPESAIHMVVLKENSQPRQMIMLNLSVWQYLQEFTASPFPRQKKINLKSELSFYNNGTCGIGSSGPKTDTGKSVHEGDNNILHMLIASQNRNTKWKQKSIWGSEKNLERG